MVFRPAEIQLERLKLLPGTPLAGDPAHWGLISNAGPPYQVTRTATLSSEELGQSDRLSKLIDWYYNAKPLHRIFAEAVEIDPSFLVRFEVWSRDRMEFTVRPGLEARFQTIHAFLLTCDASLAVVAERLCYRWFRLGFSARNGLRPAVLWKNELPPEAVLVEGDAGAKVSRKWRVELHPPHLFCYGTGACGERAVVAVYRC